MNFGYACINMSLSGLPKSKRITTNRSMIKRTFKQKGIDYASELGLLNSHDLYRILEWNLANGFSFYRLSSDIFPWSSEYRLGRFARLSGDQSDTQEVWRLCQATQYAHNNASRSFQCPWLTTTPMSSPRPSRN